ncbi:MAG TPA: HAD family hydrolase [Kofleriaceae bacterium]|nr:HAD family hydrolase [Kofleriaceae bacterium]
MRAAFFDLDKTVLRIDTAFSWVRFLYRRGEVDATYLGKAVWWSALYKMAVLDMETLATKLTATMKGQAEAELIAKTDRWHLEDVFPHVAPQARVAMARHRREGDLIVLLTGSTQYAAEVVARGLGVEHVLCSRLEVKDGLFTGKLSQMCFKHHKVPIAERFAAGHDVDLDASSFYSDSYNDLPMLSRVGTAIAVNPDARLARHARARGWRIERWG